MLQNQNHGLVDLIVEGSELDPLKLLSFAHGANVYSHNKTAALCVNKIFDWLELGLPHPTLDQTYEACKDSIFTFWLYNDLIRSSAENHTFQNYLSSFTAHIAGEDSVEGTYVPGTRFSSQALSLLEAKEQATLECQFADADNFYLEILESLDKKGLDNVVSNLYIEVDPLLRRGAPIYSFGIELVCRMMIGISHSEEIPYRVLQELLVITEWKQDKLVESRALLSQRLNRN